MPKDKNKKFRNLSLEEKVDLELAGGGLKGNVNKAARDEYRKRKKAGTLSEVIKGGKKRKRRRGKSEQQEIIQPQEPKPAISVKTTVGTKEGESITTDALGNVTTRFDKEGNPATIGDDIKKQVEVAEKLSQIAENNYRDNPELAEAQRQKFEQQKQNADNLDEQAEQEKEDIKQKDTAIKKVADAVSKGEEEANPIKDATAAELSNVQDDILNSFLDDPSDPRTAALMNQYKAAVDADKANGYEPAIEKLGLQDYYPAINQPLQVGVSHGRPIFVGSGYIPVAVVDARRRAIRDAAKKKAKVQEDILKMLFPKSAAQYKDQVDDMAMGIFNKYGKLTNWNFDKLFDMSLGLSREFWDEVMQHKALAERTIKTDKSVNQILKLANKRGENYHVPKKVWGCIQKWSSGLSDMEKFAKDKREFARLERCIKTYDNMTKTAQAAVSKIKLDKILIDPSKFKTPAERESAATRFGQILNMIESGADYDIYASAFEEFVDMDRLREIARQDVATHDFYAGEYRTEKERKKAEAKLVEDYVNYMKSFFGDRISTDITTARKYNQSLINLKAAAFGNQVAKDATILTTVHNRMKGNQDDVAGVFSFLENAGDREAAIVKLGEENGTPFITDKNGNLKNGELRYNIETSVEQKSAIFNPPATSVEYQTTDGRWLGYNEYVKYLKEKSGGLIVNADYGGAGLPKEERNFLQFVKPNTQISIGLTESTATYAKKNPDGTYTPITIESNQQDAAGADIVAEFNYSGGYTTTRVATDKERAEGKKEVVEELTLPPMREIINTGDPISVSMHEKLYSARQELKAVSKQGASTLDVGSGEGEGEEEIITYGK